LKLFDRGFYVIVAREQTRDERTARMKIHGRPKRIAQRAWVVDAQGEKRFVRGRNRAPVPERDGKIMGVALAED